MYCGHSVRRTELKEREVNTDIVMTAPARLWLFGAGCIESREQEALARKEHAITKQDFEHLRSCILSGEKPDDDTIRRVFRRPFEILGENCTEEAMRIYWHKTHQDASEKTPVYVVQVAPYYGSIYPRVDRDGVWWETWFYNQKAETFEHRVLHNIHQYKLEPGMMVYIHGSVIAEPF